MNTPSTTAAAVVTPPAGLRERGKLDKRRRLIDAARQVFIEHGYEAATTREIASRADVSIGTVFVYAKDKRDLLLMIVNDDLAALDEQVQAAVAAPGPLLPRLLSFFRPRYRFWAAEPRLARPALRETWEFVDPSPEHGDELRRFYTRRPLMIGQVQQMVRDAQAAGAIDADVPPDEVATLLFDLYLVEVRRWLSADAPDLDTGVQRLARVLGLFLRGLSRAAPSPPG